MHTSCYWGSCKYREPQAAVGLTGRDPGLGLGSHLFDLVFKFLLWRFQLDCATVVMMHRQFAGTDRLSHTSQARREVGHQTALCLLPRLRGRSSCSGEHYGTKAKQKHNNSTLTLTLTLTRQDVVLRLLQVASKCLPPGSAVASVNNPDLEHETGGLWLLWRARLLLCHKSEAPLAAATAGLHARVE